MARIKSYDRKTKYHDTREPDVSDEPVTAKAWTHDPRKKKKKDEQEDGKISAWTFASKVERFTLMEASVIPIGAGVLGAGWAIGFSSWDGLIIGAIAGGLYAVICCISLSYYADHLAKKEERRREHQAEVDRMVMKAIELQEELAKGN